MPKGIRKGEGLRASTKFTRQLTAWMALRDYDDVQLARRLGVAKSTVGNWRLGKTTPDEDKWLALAQALGVERDEIAELLFDVKLLPADVRIPAEALAGLPLRVRQPIVEELQHRIAEASNKAKVAAGDDRLVANHANGAA